MQIFEISRAEILRLNRGKHNKSRIVGECVICESDRFCHEPRVQFGSGLVAMLRQQLSKTLGTKFISGCVGSFGDSICIHHYPIAGIQFYFALRRGPIFEFAEHRAAIAEFQNASVGTCNQRRIVTRVDVRKNSARRIEHATKKCYVSSGLAISAENAIHFAAQFHRRKIFRRVCFYRSLQIRHHQRSGRAFAGNVANTNQCGVSAQRENIVIISRKTSGRAACRGNSKSGKSRDRSRQQQLLSFTRFVPLEFSGNFFAASSAANASAIELRAKNSAKSAVVPRLLNEVAGSALHRFHRDFDAAPRRHDDDREVAIDFANRFDKRQAFIAAGGIACVIQIEQSQIELPRANGVNNGRRRTSKFNQETFVAQSKAKRFANVRLIVCN